VLREQNQSRTAEALQVWSLAYNQLGDVFADMLAAWLGLSPVRRGLAVGDYRYFNVEAYAQTKLEGQKN